MLRPFCDVCGTEIPPEIKYGWLTESHTITNIVVEIRAIRPNPTGDSIRDQSPHICVGCVVTMAENIIGKIKDSPEWRMLKSKE